jgi:hypothetical protein
MAAFGRARIEPSPIVLVESQTSVRAHWMLDSSADGDSWIRRLSSYEGEHGTSIATRASWCRLFEDLGFQVRFVTEAALPVTLATDRPRLVVLPAQLSLGDATATALTSYVEGGGHLLADWGAGIYDCSESPNAARGGAISSCAMRARTTPGGCPMARRSPRRRWRRVSVSAMAIAVRFRSSRGSALGGRST